MREELKNSENWAKRFLPHYNADEKLQLITYRLADSLPQEKLAHIEKELKLGAPHSDAGLNSMDFEVHRRIKIEKFLDQSLGSCLLKYPDIADKVLDALKYKHGKMYDLIAYVVMPNHVHVLIKTKTGSNLGKIVWSWKKYVSTYVFSVPKYVSQLQKASQNIEGLYSHSRAPETKKRYIKPASECGAPRLKLW